MRTARFLALLLFLSGLLFAETRFVVQTSHSDQVRGIARQSASGRVISSAGDGTVKVWQNGTLLYSRQVSHLPLTSLTVHPRKPIGAFVATDNINTYRLIVYNWEEDRELFSIRIDELPLSIGFSPRGSYLFYSRTDQRSLSILDAETGAPTGIAQSGFGIVSSAFISATESTMVCYLSSGGIIYWDMENNQRKAAPISTARNLELVDFSSNGRYGIGYRSGTLYLFDLVTGRTVDTVMLDGVIDIAAHPDESSIALIRNTGRLQEAAVYDFSDRRLVQRFRFPLNQGQPLCIDYGAGGINLGLDNGVVARVIPDSALFQSWGQNRLATLSDIDLWNGSIALSGAGRLTLMDSAELRKSSPESPRSLDQTVISLPFSSQAGFLPLDSSRGVFWSSSRAENAYLFSVSTAGFKPLFPVAAACEEIYADGDRLLSLDRNGSIFLYNISEEQLKYRYAASGIRDVTFIDAETIIAGRNPSERFPSPLMRINLRTGETVPLEATDLLTFSLRYDPITRSLYTLGLQNRQGRIMTVLKQLQGDNFQRRQPLLSFPGEDHSATFVLDSLRVFTSLGHSGIQVSDWQGFSALDSVEHIPRKISIDETLLASLNSNSSVSIWSKRSGGWLGDFYLFDDGQWVFVRNDKKIVASERGMQFLKIFEDGREVSSAPFRQR
jgi:WD40 repeat protein